MTNRELTEAIETGIINLDNVQQIIMNSKRTRVMKLHTYKVSQTTDGRYQTMFKKPDGKRLNVKAQSEEEVWDKLVNLYFPSESHIDKLTFGDVFHEWIDYKETSTNNRVRIEQDYNRFFADSKLAHMAFNKIDKLTLNKYCNQIIKNGNVLKSAWDRGMTVLHGMYEYAIDKHYTEIDLSRQIKITVRFQQAKAKTSQTEVYNHDESKDLISYLDTSISDNADAVYYAIKLNFLLGLRVGELVALKWSDIEGNQLHVSREEIRDREHNLYYVANHTKSNQDGYVILVPNALDILRQIKHQGEYIFMRDGKRITSRQVNYQLEKYAKHKGVATKASHKIRKTYASTLADAGVPLNNIKEQLRQSCIASTYHYIYSTHTESENYDMIRKALS